MIETETTTQPIFHTEMVLDEISRLPAPPERVGQVLESLDGAMNSPGRLAELLAQESEMADYVLEVANTIQPRYGMQYDSLDHVMLWLGDKQVRALVISSVAAGALKRRLEGYRLGDGALWQHSIATANIGRWVAKELDYPEPEEAYLSGMLHDMGKPLLDPYVTMDYDRIVETMWKRKMHLWQVEEQLFGIDHAGLGGLMAAQWNLPAATMEAIRYHHHPDRAATHAKLAAILNIANAFAPQDSLGISALAGRMIHPETLAILNLDMPFIEVLRARMLQEINSTASTINQLATSGAWIERPPGSQEDLGLDEAGIC